MRTAYEVFMFVIPLIVWAWFAATCLSFAIGERVPSQFNTSLAFGMVGASALVMAVRDFKRGRRRLEQSGN